MRGEKSYIRKIVLLSAFLGLSCLSVSAHASIFYQLTSDIITTQFYPGDPSYPLSPLPAETTAYLATGGGLGYGSPMPNLTADFADPDKTITLHLAAPTGKMFSVVPPNGFDYLNLTVRLTGGTAGTYIDNPWLQSFSFDNLSGSMPHLDYGRFIGNGSLFNAEVSATLSGPISFTGMTIVWNVPTDYNASFSDLALSNLNNIKFLARDTSGQSSNPGNWVTLSPVPEPASLLLLGSGLVGGVFLKKRKTKDPE